jgi:hypothetical protein
MRTPLAVCLCIAALPAFPALAQTPQPPKSPGPDKTRAAPAIRQTFEQQADTSSSLTAAPQMRHWLTIGNVGVGIWAPVEPAYDPNANRTLAGNPLWEAGRTTASPSGF